ncbi:hypothetical protein [Granulicella sp. S156]|uniref:hypothetical protein n=1 Tax=Granulicella sp. S156 TaxID=1747224 RepID=UPI00131E3038|nr:hypothetical protein [Granulicella sp. S156]
MNFIRSLAVPASLAALLLAGCHVTTHKDGKNDNVDIGTPFGSMQVKTDNKGNSATIGITTYPGAALIKSNSEKSDGGSADINMNFGSFHLGVKAASYQTSDPQSKVEAFYRKDLARYGDVIACRDNNPVGQPTRTSQGLTCDSKHGNHIHEDDSNSGLELRTGSEQHQHIVGIEAKDGGTKIGMVALDLPTGLGSHDSKDSDSE